MNETARAIRQAMDSMRVADVHSHLGTGGVWKATSLADIVSYHWLSVELARAVAVDHPEVFRDDDLDPPRDPQAYFDAVLPYFPAIRNTVNHFALVGMLRDLYGFEGHTLTAENWERLDASVRQRAGDENRVAEVLDRGKIEKVSVAYHEKGMPDPSGRCFAYEYAEYLCCPSSPDQMPSAGGAPPQTLEALEAAIAERIDWLALEKRVRVLHVYRPHWRYVEAERAAVAEALARFAGGERLEQDEWSKLAGFTADCAARAAGRQGMVVQLFLGMERYGKMNVVSEVSTYEPGQLRSFIPWFGKHPDTQFDVFLGTRIPSHEAASIARVYQNLAVSGAWWHGFTPTTLSTFFRDRLEALPHTCWNAFYSDGYTVEWVYAKLLVTKNRLSLALAGMVDEDLVRIDDAFEMAAKLLYDNAVGLYGL